MSRLLFHTHLTRFASFSCWLIAATSAAARSAGSASTSQILFDFNGPLMQFGPTAPIARGTKDASVTKAIAENETILRDRVYEGLVNDGCIKPYLRGLPYPRAVGPKATSYYFRN